MRRPTVPRAIALLAVALACAGCPDGEPLLPDAACAEGEDGPPGIALTVAVHYRAFDSGTLDEYELAADEVDWLAGWAARHELVLELALNGYQAEGALASGAEDRYAALAAAGHGFGVHHHPTARDDALVWRSVGDDPDDDALQRSVDDHRAWIAAVLDDQGIPSPGGHLRLTGRTDWWYGMMIDAGYQTETLDAWITAATDGAETERAFDVLHPMRWQVGGEPGTLRPDPTVPFVLVPQHPQIGILGQGEHGRFDGSLEHLQALLLIAYLEWREAALAGEDPPPVVFGLTVHPERGAAHNEELEAFAAFARDTFAAPATPRWSRSLCAASRDDIVARFERWEAEHPGEAPFSFVPGDPYPYRLPQLERIHGAHLVALRDDLSPAALRVAELQGYADPGDGTVDDLVPTERMLLAWAERDGDVALDTGDWTDGAVDVWDGDGRREAGARGAIAVGREPLVLVLE